MNKLRKLREVIPSHEEPIIPKPHSRHKKLFPKEQRSKAAQSLIARVMAQSLRALGWPMICGLNSTNGKGRAITARKHSAIPPLKHLFIAKSLE